MTTMTIQPEIFILPRKDIESHTLYQALIQAATSAYPDGSVKAEPVMRDEKDRSAVIEQMPFEIIFDKIITVETRLSKFLRYFDSTREEIYRSSRRTFRI
ncbi:MAG: hypothetical protein G01um101433_227, partial [Parcubacteria group bacterium Gr01-1014_33]